MKIDWKVLCVYGWVWVFLLAPLRVAGAVINLSWQQRWPWNGMVDITYSIECPDKNWDGTPVDIRMSFVGYDRDRDRKIEMKTLSGQGVDGTVQTGGPYKVTWNADKDCPGFHSSSFKIKATAVTQLKTQIAVDQKLYLVIDLSGGASATSYPFHYSENGPEVSGDLCRTTELWLRKIPAGTFVMGSPDGEVGRGRGETQHQVTLTKPFYIGIFEVTQKQWERVMGNNPVTAVKEYRGDDRPVEQVSYGDIRGNGIKAGAGWPKYGHTVDADSFLGKIQAKTGLVLDLPTEAQWEYACRAGTVTALNSGENLPAEEQADSPMNAVGRYAGNVNDGRGGYSGYYTRVGSYQPNNWGLYDMHGNVEEWCLDWWVIDWGTAPVRDPRGAEDGGMRMARGGSYWVGSGSCRSASRRSTFPSSCVTNIGMRLVCIP